jgi:hypothetical protein
MNVEAPKCPKCGGTAGSLGTSFAYFICDNPACPRNVYWTPDFEHPSDWQKAIEASPWARARQRLERQGVMGVTPERAAIEIAKEAAEAGARTPQIKCVIGEYCTLHGFIHGAEAEELRERFEKALADAGQHLLRNTVRRILDDVDARDSAAFLSRELGAAVGGDGSPHPLKDLIE